METYDLFEWLRGIARWVHLFAAILWIGQTYLFHFFEHNLERPPGASDNTLGHLWMVHGGGYYVVEKQRYPEVMPKTLHWFKWEAAVTWLSGMLLLALTYYAGGFLTELEQRTDIAIACGVGMIFGGWLVYDLMMRSPLASSMTAFAAVGLAILMALAWSLKAVMASRAVYIHIGAMLGTIMVANVWMRILPSMTKMIVLAREGKAIDPSLAATGPTRSKHNSYMVVPLMFLMISNHYPTVTYGNTNSWLVLGIIMVAGWGAARFVLGR